MDKPAFPRPASDIVSNDWDFLQHFEAQDGLTRRELFAAMAMHALISGEGAAVCARASKAQTDDDVIAAVTKSSLRWSDALIAALDAEPPK